MNGCHKGFSADVVLLDVASGAARYLSFHF